MDQRRQIALLNKIRHVDSNAVLRDHALLSLRGCTAGETSGPPDSAWGEEALGGSGPHARSDRDDVHASSCRCHCSLS